MILLLSPHCWTYLKEGGFIRTECYIVTNDKKDHYITSQVYFECPEEKLIHNKSCWSSLRWSWWIPSGGLPDQGWFGIRDMGGTRYNAPWQSLMADHRFCRRDYFRFTTAPIFIGWIGPENVTPGWNRPRREINRKKSFPVLAQIHLIDPTV